MPIAISQGLGVYRGSVLGSGSAPPAFSPGDLATVDGWYKETNKTRASNGWLQQWDDISGNARHITISNGGTSVQVTSGHSFNGMDATHTAGFTFSSYMLNGWTPVDNQPLFVAVRCRRDYLANTGGSTLRPVVSFGPSGLQLCHGNDPSLAAQNVVRTYDGSTVQSAADDSWLPGEACNLIMQYDHNGGSPLLTVWKDGVIVIGPVSCAANPFGPMVIGRDTDRTDRVYQGYIMEIVTGQMLLSTNEVADLNTYLNRWETGRTATVIHSWSGSTQIMTDVQASQGTASGDGFIFTTANDSDNLSFQWWDGTTFVNRGIYDTSGDNGGLHVQVNGAYYDPAANTLWLGANNFNTTPARGWILRYDFDPAANSGNGGITFNAAYPVADNWCEGAAPLSDGTWIACYHDVARLDRYSADFSTRLNTYDLPVRYIEPGGNHFQGVSIRDDVVVLPYHGNAGADWNFYPQFKFVDGGLYEAEPNLETIANNARQGLFNEGSSFLAAIRTNNNPNSNNHVNRATPVTYTADIG